MAAETPAGEHRDGRATFHQFAIVRRIRYLSIYPALHVCDSDFFLTASTVLNNPL